MYSEQNQAVTFSHPLPDGNELNCYSDELDFRPLWKRLMLNDEETAEADKIIALYHTKPKTQGQVPYFTITKKELDEKCDPAVIRYLTNDGVLEKVHIEGVSPENRPLTISSQAIIEMALCMLPNEDILERFTFSCDGQTKNTEMEQFSEQFSIDKYRHHILDIAESEGRTDEPPTPSWWKHTPEGWKPERMARAEHIDNIRKKHPEYGFVEEDAVYNPRAGLITPPHQTHQDTVTAITD